MNNILEAIPNLYPRNNSGKYFVEFDDVFFADKFAKGIQKQFEALGFSGLECQKLIEQRMGKVYIDVDSALSIYNVEKEICEVMS